MAARRNQGPQPSLAPFIVLGGIAVAAGAVAYGYPPHPRDLGQPHCRRLA